MNAWAGRLGEGEMAKTGRKLGAWTLGSAFLSIAMIHLAPSPVNAAPVSSRQAACQVVKSVIHQRLSPATSIRLFCDIIPADSGLAGFYVLSVHSGRQCDGICSSNMGWFAVEKASGKIFEWDVGEWKLGPRVKG